MHQQARNRFASMASTHRLVERLAQQLIEWHVVLSWAMIAAGVLAFAVLVSGIAAPYGR